MKGRWHLKELVAVVGVVLFLIRHVRIESKQHRPATSIAIPLHDSDPTNEIALRQLEESAQLSSLDLHHATNGGRSFLVRVTTSNGTALPGSSILVGEPDTGSVTHTGADGVAPVFIDGINEAAITVGHRGFITQHISVAAAQENGELVVALQAGATISGIIVTRVTRTPLAIPGITVIAWASGSLPEHSFIDCSARKCPLLPITTTDESGRFEIGGLPPNSVFNIEAAGKGLATPSDLIAVPTGTSDAVLEVAPIYAALVRCVSEDGSSIHCSPILCRFGRNTVSCQGQTIGPEWLATIAGFGTKVPRTGSSLQERLILRTEDSDAATIGPARVVFSFPGYDEESVDIPLHRLDGPIHEYEVMLHDRASGRGSIRLHVIRPVVGERWASNWSCELGVVRMNCDQRDLSCQFPVFVNKDGQQEICGIPFGRYKFSFTSTSKLCTAPGPGAAERFVDIDRPVLDVSIELPRAGALEAMVRGPNGTLFSGSAWIELMNEHALYKTIATYSFAGPPYTMECLSPGRFRWRMHFNDIPFGLPGLEYVDMSDDTIVTEGTCAISIFVVEQQ